MPNKALRVDYEYNVLQACTQVLRRRFELVPAGTRLGLSHLEKLRNYARLAGIREPISVLSRG